MHLHWKLLVSKHMQMYSNVIQMYAKCTLFVTDSWLHINTAMFEQNGRCGYVLKPRVMWDSSHPMYNRFNPLDKEYYGIRPATLHVTVSVNVLHTLTLACGSVLSSLNASNFDVVQFWHSWALKLFQSTNSI